MSSRHDPRHPARRFPVSVVMERKQVQHRRWSVPQWEAVGVVVGEAAGTEHTVIPIDEQREQHLWPGFAVHFYKDCAESYWYNLVGRTPSLFVICRESEGDDLRPVRVTVNYDEATAHAEGDDAVFSVPIPNELYEPLERFVMDNYVPEPPKKRKRRDWTKEAFDGRRRSK